MQNLYMVTYYSLDNYKTQRKFYKNYKSTRKFVGKLILDGFYPTLWQRNDDYEWDEIGSI